MGSAMAFGAADPLPTEFRIFAAGMNTTRQGDFLFDEVAASVVMEAYERHGTDLMIDLEHLSLDEESRAYDPDARGWCKLEVRNGELWAVAVTWTPDGESRLREKRQRYVSPVFAFNEKSRRVGRVLNIAITALPATDHLEPLVAANLLGGENTMSPEQLAAIAEALGLGADANVEDVLATIAAMVKKVQDAANGNATAEDTSAEPPAEGTPAAAAASAPPVMVAARIQTATHALVRLTGKKDIGEAVREAEAWRTSHLELETQRAKLTQERAALEGGERRRLVGELVKLGAEIPATAWADDDATKPAEPWASMPIATLRDRVAKLTKAKGGGAGARTTSTGAPPRATADEEGGEAVIVRGETVQLSAHEVAACKDSGAKVEDYAANKLIRTRAQAARRSA
jgi:phage I-like protein